MVNMSFPVFVATWEDGRQFVIDAGLSATEAIEFGRRSELAGSMPLEFHGLAADQLDLDKVKGIGLTHLHSDHTTGISAFCDAGADFALVQSMEQFSWHDYLTSDSATLINELTCGVQLILDDGLLLKGVRGFPGLYIVHVGGHTLGSQLFVLHINEGSSIGTYIIAGDMANHFDGINYNVSKPPVYSRWLVPENLDQLYKVRSWLKQMNQDTNITVLLSHDKAHLIESGLPEL
jgi:glyoxylase-like metal-dependent hydrolase (beta-lactamase superfamily II)